MIIRKTLPAVAACFMCFALSCSMFSTGRTMAPDDPEDIVEPGSGEQTLAGFGPGEACQATAECIIGASCAGGVCMLEGAGLPCSADDPCPVGLVCASGVCAELEPGSDGFLCNKSEDCNDGLVCSIDTENLNQPKTCGPEGDGEEWDLCTTEKDCKKGFYCKIVSFTGICQEEGTEDVGGECDDTGDCKAGLYCGADGACGIMGGQIPLFTGEECESTTQMGGEPRVLFEVPRNGQPLKDFYRLPFPNDIRIVDGKLDLIGHPTPGPGAVGYDVAQRVIKAMQEDLEGFGTNPVVFIRFSTEPKLGTINPKGGDKNVFLLDITDPADSYGKPIEFSWVASTGRGLYICRNYLALHVPWARPLRGNRTYAVILHSSIKASAAEEGGSLRDFEHDADFKTMLSDSAPDDADMKKAWDKYAKLRDFLASNEASNLDLNKSSVIGATVFTTYDPLEGMSKFKEKLHSDSVQLVKITDAVLCDGNHVSPCDDGLAGDLHERGCMGPHPDYHEIQGKVKIPTFQQMGEKPFLEPEDGGGLVWDAYGHPTVNSELEEVCFTLTIPKGTAPEAGWPVVLYGHGTGGGYTSHLKPSVAGEMSNLKVWNADTEQFDRDVPLATFGWDQVLHGPRVGPAPLAPNALVFNFRNPKAALGNFYQSAAETLFMAMLMNGWAEVAPDIADVDLGLDPDNVMFLGHSQGGISGALAAPFMEEISTIVLSGTGGGLVESLLRKSSPVDIKDGVIVALQDENVSRTHPLLALLQHYYEPVDPINYGKHYFFEPIDGHSVTVLHPLGLGDLHTPPKTMKALAGAMRSVVAPGPSLLSCVSEPVLACSSGCDSGLKCVFGKCLSPAEQPQCKPPCSGSGLCDFSLFEKFGGVQLVLLPRKVSTGLTVEYAPVDGEGHFVIFERPDANLHYLNFLGTKVLDGKAYVPF